MEIEMAHSLDGKVCRCLSVVKKEGRNVSAGDLLLLRLSE